MHPVTDAPGGPSTATPPARTMPNTEKVCNQIQTAREAERRIDAADSERGDKIRKDVRKNGLYNQRKGRKR